MDYTHHLGAHGHGIHHTDCFPHPQLDHHINLIAGKIHTTHQHPVVVLKNQTLHDGWNGNGSIHIDSHGHQESASINYDHGNVSIGGTVSNSGNFHGGNTPSFQIGGTIHFK